MEIIRDTLSITFLFREAFVRVAPMDAFCKSHLEVIFLSGYFLPYIQGLAFCFPQDDFSVFWFFCVFLSFLVFLTESSFFSF